jgi:hypothetical protein
MVPALFPFIRPISLGCSRRGDVQGAKRDQGGDRAGHMLKQDSINKTKGNIAKQDRSRSFMRANPAPLRRPRSAQKAGLSYCDCWTISW